MGLFILLILSLLCAQCIHAYSTVTSSPPFAPTPLSSMMMMMTTTLPPPPTTTTTTTAELSPVLQQMIDERRVYEMNLGHAMDTLRKDYSTLFIQSLDFSIYSLDLTLVDPSMNIQLQGLSNYKTAFAFLQTLVKFFYHTSAMSSYVQHRMVYDFARQAIRISWNAQLTPKLIVGSDVDAARVYLDGISVYKLDCKSGKIIEHKIEHLVINGSSVLPPQNVFSTLKDVLVSTGTGMTRNAGSGARNHGIPVGVGAWGIIAHEAEE